MARNEELRIQNNTMENKFMLKMLGIICSTILGIITLIGIFWGKNYLIGLGIAILIGLVVALFSQITFRNEPYY